MAKDGGYILPTNPSTEDMTCIRINLPNDPFYRRAFWGALWELTFYSNWQQGDQAALDIVVGRMQTMWWDAVEAWSPEQGECEVFDIRVIGGMLQKTYNGGIEWLDVSPISVGNPIQSVVTNTLPAGEDATATLNAGILTLGIPQGAQGVQGVQGIQGVQGVAGVNGTAGAAGADAKRYVGEIILWAGAANTVPAGWVLCNGGFVDKAANAALYAILGGRYGETVDEFQVPNLTERFVRYALNDAALGGAGGAETVTLTAANLPPHDHAIAARDNSAIGGGARLVSASGAGTEATKTSGSGGGTSTPFDIMPPYLDLYYIICVDPEPELTVEFQVVDCDLQWRKNGGAWSTLVDLSQCTVQGAQGVQGIQGIQGVQGQQGVAGDCDCDDVPTPIDNTAETWCGIANEFTRWMEQYLIDVVEKTTISASIAEALNNIIGTIPVIGWEYDAMAETVTQAFETGGEIIFAQLTQAIIEYSRDQLFDYLVANDGFDLATLRAWQEAMEIEAGASLNVGWVIYMSTLNDFSDADLNRRAYIGSLAPSAQCLPCPDQTNGFSAPDGTGQSGATWEGLTGATMANPCNVAETGWVVGALREVTLIYPQVVTFGMFGNPIEVTWFQPEADDGINPTVEINGTEYATVSGARVICGLGIAEMSRTAPIPTPVISDRVTIRFNTAEDRWLKAIEAPICP